MNSTALKNKSGFLDFLKDHSVFLSFFGVLYLFFVAPFLTFTQGLVKGDYGAQFYPWSWAYAEALKHGKILLWTPLIQSGFPLFAEGQTGMLYLPNLALFRFLPFHIAYNTDFLIHYLLGGTFAYMFGRSKGLSGAAGTLTAICFTFGSASAGGFYTLGTLKTLCWFPLILLLIDRYSQTNRIRELFWLALIVGQTWLAGFVQMAAYQFGFAVFYYYLSGGFKRSNPVLLAGSLLAALVIGLPQIWATLELAAHSTRTLQEPEFALWGSMAPWSLSLLFFYGWNGILSSNFYIGFAPVALAVLIPRSGRSGLWWVLLAISLAMALGRFNPLYWILIKFPIASLLRNPSKFLFFAAFFLSMIAGFSFDAFMMKLKQPTADWTKRIHQRFLILALSVAAMAALLFAMAHVGAGILDAFGHWYIKNFVAGKSFHQRSIDTYFGLIQTAIAELRASTNPFQNPVILVPFIQILVFAVVWRRKIAWINAARIILFLLCLDLVVYGYGLPGFKAKATSIICGRGNFLDLRPLASAPQGKWLEISKNGKDLCPPSMNIPTGHSNVNAYSPLLDKDYYALVKDLGGSDDSLGRRPFSETAFNEKRDLINFLGVDYVLSDIPINDFSSEGRLKVGGTEKEYFRNPARKQEFSFLKNINKGADFSASKQVSSEIIDRQNDGVRLRVTMPEAGYLVRNQTYDQNWTVTADGRKSLVERALGAFQGVFLSAGSHELWFKFEPKYYTIGLWAHLAVLALVLVGLCATYLPNPS